MGEPAVTLTYDGNGNTATRVENGVTTTYSWYMDDKMTGLTTSDSSQSATHVYAYNGDRMGRTLNGTTWSYLYSKEDILKVAQPGGSLTLTQGPGIDDVLAETHDGTTLYAYKNMLSSVVSLADAAGTVTRFYPYGAWGNTSTWPDLATDPNPYGYTGREWELGESEYYRNRIYTPIEARFTSSDPANLVDFTAQVDNASIASPLLYKYVSNNPIMLSDPFGQQASIPGSSSSSASSRCCKPCASGKWILSCALRGFSDVILGGGSRSQCVYKCADAPWTNRVPVRVKCSGGGPVLNIGWNISTSSLGSALKGIPNSCGIPDESDDWVIETTLPYIGWSSSVWGGHVSVTFGIGKGLGVGVFHCTTTRKD